MHHDVTEVDHNLCNLADVSVLFCNTQYDDVCTSCGVFFNVGAVQVDGLKSVVIQWQLTEFS